MDGSKPTGLVKHRRRRDGHCSGLQRRKTIRWSQKEVDGLLEGVRTYGVGKWATILRSSPAFNKARTSVDLKDKWRNLASSVRATAVQQQHLSKDDDHDPSVCRFSAHPMQQIPLNPSPHHVEHPQLHAIMYSPQLISSAGDTNALLYVESEGNVYSSPVTAPPLETSVPLQANVASRVSTTHSSEQYSLSVPCLQRRQRLSPSVEPVHATRTIGQRPLEGRSWYCVATEAVSMAAPAATSQSGLASSSRFLAESEAIGPVCPNEVTSVGARMTIPQAQSYLNYFGNDLAIKEVNETLQPGVSRCSEPLEAAAGQIVQYQVDGNELSLVETVSPAQVLGRADHFTVCEMD